MTSSSYINTGLTYGTFYYYKLVAANLAGLGPASTEISAKPLPPAPVLSLGFGIKQLQFSWIAMPGAAYYKLMENPDGASGYTQVGGNLVGTNTALDIVVFRHNWANARYLVSACNSSNVCVDSNEVFTVGGG